MTIQKRALQLLNFRGFELRELDNGTWELQCTEKYSTQSIRLTAPQVAVVADLLRQVVDGGNGESKQ